MSGCLTGLKVCHVGLFVCLEPADCHGGGQEPVGGPGNGPGQLWPVRAAALVGSHQLLGGRCHSPSGEGCVAGLAPVAEMDTVPD